MAAKKTRKTRRTKTTKRRSRKTRRSASSRRSSSRRSTTVTTPRVTRMSALTVDNRKVRQAINDLSGFCHASPGHKSRISYERAHRAVQCLASLDINRMGTGRRGGLTRGNATSALNYIARWEMRTGKKLKKTGGFPRSAVEAAKKIVRRYESPSRRPSPVVYSSTSAQPGTDFVVGPDGSCRATDKRKER